MRDPRWLIAKYRGKCAKCHREILPGAKAFYYPVSRSIFCEAETCGKFEQGKFIEAIQDEETYNYGSDYRS